jgi:hypothetical protein
VQAELPLPVLPWRVPWWLPPLSTLEDTLMRNRRLTDKVLHMRSSRRGGAHGYVAKDQRL